jgi:hypothetical protein
MVSMDVLLIFSILILAILSLNAIVLAIRLRMTPPKPLGKGIGLALGLVMGLALWLPVGYAIGDQDAGIVVGSMIGIGIGVGLELWSRNVTLAS